MTYFETWLNLLTNMKRSTNTVETYGRNVRQFLVSEFGSLDNRSREEYESVTIDDVLEYNEATFNADSSKNLSQIAIHLFWGFLAERSIITKNNLERTKLISLEEPIPKPFTIDEVNAIYATIDNSPYSRCVDRDVAIMSIMLAIPVRKSEIVKLKLSDYSEIGELTFRNRKGKKNTIVGCSRRIIIAIDRYLNARNDDCEYLFAKEDFSGPMGIDAIDNVVWKYAGCNPHKLRSTAATMMYKSGIPLERIEVIGSWQKNSITLRRNYIRIDSEDTRADLESTEKFISLRK